MLSPGPRSINYCERKTCFLLYSGENILLPARNERIIMQDRRQLDIMKSLYPEKFPTEERIFKNIHPGNRIFIGTG